MEVEYATDVIFFRQSDFQPLYDALTHTAIHAIKPGHVATFLGRKLTGHYQGGSGGRLRNPDSRHAHQASLGPGSDQTLRQIRTHRPR